MGAKRIKIKHYVTIKCSRIIKKIKFLPFIQSKAENIYYRNRERSVDTLSGKPGLISAPTSD